MLHCIVQSLQRAYWHLSGAAALWTKIVQITEQRLGAGGYFLFSYTVAE
jgi:hypothetical protein